MLPEERQKQLEVAFTEALCWMREDDTGDGLACYLAVNPKNTAWVNADWADWIFTEYELAQADPRLPSVFAHLCALDVDNPGFMAKTLRSTLNLFRRTAVELSPELQAQNNLANSKIFSFDTITVIPHRKWVQLTFVDYVLAKTTDGIEYADPLYPKVIKAPVEWLDKAVPGWLQKYHVGVSLDMGPAELANFVMHNADQSPTAHLHGLVLAR